jgi:glycosyltransferase involved in cell wall biosynthesis
MQYIPYLSGAGFDVEVASLFDAKYLDEMYAGRRPIASMKRYYLNRLHQLRSSADLVWLEKEALPWIPWPIEKFVWPKNIPVVSDYDDAIFHRYDQSRHGVVRTALGRKIDHVMRASKVVFAGNKYLAERARKAGAERLEIVPTVLDIEAYTPGQIEHPDGRVRLGWVGTPETWSRFASQYADMLSDEANKLGAVCRIVGAEAVLRFEEPFEFLPWSEETEVAAIKGMDIGLMPLPDTPWTRGKCGYKLIQYMACGLPVVASPVSVNKEIVEHGVNGFLAESDEEWRLAIETLLSDADMRRRMGAAGRKKVEDSYSLEVWGPRVAQMLRQVADEGQKA